MKTTPLYDEPEAINSTPSFGKLDSGEQLSVLRIRYSKNFMYMKVEKKNGTVGWIIFQPDSMELDKK